MDKEALYQRIEQIKQEEMKAAQKEAPAAEKGGKEQPWTPIDIYRNNQRKLAINRRKEFPKGSRALVGAVTESIINGSGAGDGLARAKRRAEDDCESLKASGDKDRAELVKQQYMEDNFIPAVEVVIEYSSPDELLNCKEALAAFDKMALGVGSMSGYTASYVREAYGGQLGQKQGESDPTVVAEMRKLRALVDKDEIRTAIGLAQRLKKQIDEGEHQAGPEDYAVIGRMVSYAN